VPPAHRGYDLCTDDGYAATFEEFDRIVGLGRIRVFSPERFEETLRQPRRSPRAHRQRMSRAGPFRRLLNDPRFAGLPMLLETPKLENKDSKRRSDVDPWDARNLRTLRKLIFP
jgi:deoxyribonuclease-4